MPSQPTTPAPVPTPSVSSTAAICLAVSAFAAAGLAGIILVDTLTPIEPSRGLTGLLAAACAIFGIAYITRSREDRISQRQADTCRIILDRIDQLQARMDEHASRLTEQGEETKASMFVANVAGSRHLSAVPRQG